jgi:hypothetical protein
MLDSHALRRLPNIMHTMNPSFCIVASTLPVGFIATQLDALRIKRIYVLSKEHELSHQSLKKRNPSLDIVRVPSGLLLQSACFLFILLRARLANRPVIFFHECCLPILDLLLCAIRPQGFYFPQVTMSGFEEIEPAEFPRSRMYRLLKLLGVIDCFRFYRSPSVGSNEIEYVVSIRRYPDTITCMDVSYSREAVSRCYSDGGANTSKILFVVGKTFVADIRQFEIFSLLVASAHAKGYSCHIKDHPNPIYRLNLRIEGGVTIDPLIPIELMDKDYHLAVGVSSSALLGFNERAISLINLLEDMSQKDRQLCVNHFESAYPGNRINYICSLDEFRKFL